MKAKESSPCTAKEYFREYVERALLAAEEEGLDLTTDSLNLTFTYPDLPYVQVSLTIGGMFSNYQVDNEDLQ
jgi:hypothetical protein